MNAVERRSLILSQLQQSDTPITGSELARRFSISRQIVVQDVALLRAAGQNILATPDGYVIPRPALVKRVRRSYRITHNPQEAEAELYTIVKLGGTVIDVSVQHAIYGELKAMMMLSSPEDVASWLERFKKEEAFALEVLTNELHRHTVEADSEEILDAIADKLRIQGFLAE